MQTVTDNVVMPDFDFIHTGPDTLAGRYMRMFWQPVYRSDDLEAGRDAGVVLLRRLWRRELAALAEGERIKKWTRPTHLVATTGAAEP
jgi:hypothetical protein